MARPRRGRPPKGRLSRIWKTLSPLARAGVAAVILAVLGGFGGWLWSIAQHRIELRQPVVYSVRVDAARYADGDTADPTVIRPGGPVISASQEFPTCDATHAWMKKHGAVDHLTFFKVTVQGQVDAAVSIEDIRAHIVDRAPIIANGTFVECFTGGVNPIESLHYDLDGQGSSEPYGVTENGGYSTTPYFEDNTVTLAKNESETFRVDATACGCDCNWELVLDLTVDGKPHEVHVRQPNGDLFETTDVAEPARWLEWSHLENPSGGLSPHMPQSDLKTVHSLCLQP
jgi:hypothetical protein